MIFAFLPLFIFFFKDIPPWGVCGSVVIQNSANAYLNPEPTQALGISIASMNWHFAGYYLNGDRKKLFDGLSKQRVD